MRLYLLILKLRLSLYCNYVPQSSKFRLQPRFTNCNYLHLLPPRFTPAATASYTTATTSYTCYIIQLMHKYLVVMSTSILGTDIKQVATTAVLICQAVEKGKLMTSRVVTEIYLGRRSY